MPSLYNIPVSALKKIGPKKEQQFERLGVRSVGDLLRFYPRTYEDWSNPSGIADAPADRPCCIRGRIIGGKSPVRLKNKMTLFKLHVTDEKDYMNIVFFNRDYLYEKIRDEDEMLFYGTVKLTSNGYEMTSPQVCPVDRAIIRPVYPQTASLSSKDIENAVSQALKMLPDHIKDPIPLEIRKEFDLCELGIALHNIHFPNTAESAVRARKRMVFEELLLMQLGIMMKGNQQLVTKTLPIHTDYTDSFLKLLPYTLTKAQSRVISQCIEDMKRSGIPMNRLIQGDVGSGKTMVAAAVCYTAVKNGLQCAFMAPTELLAEQHYNTLSALFKDTGITLALLTGSTKESRRRIISDGLETGSLQAVIGTHALLSDNVRFKRLGLVITDEQHRFGVAQRALLTSKGEYPHTMVMSATPIPRTLALMIYGDLDASVIDEMPPGRKNVRTYLADGEKRGRIYGFIKKEVDRGRQCYIVCPLVEDNETELFSAEEYKSKLMKTQLRDCRIGLLHGRMKAKDKESVMKDFSAGNIDILVSTTVIEVGVDVPNASVMVIENAERFGLSQLHQLRGRVGRGAEQSYCIMISDNANPQTIDRLKIMCMTNDGFIIADEDLRIRGPGDFFGTRQHGLPELKAAKLTDIQSVAEAQDAARQIILNDPHLTDKAHSVLRSEVRRVFGYSGNGQGLFGTG